MLMFPKKFQCFHKRLNFPNFLLIRLGGEDKSKNLYWSLRTETTLRKNISRPRTTCYFSLFSQQIRAVLYEIRKVYTIN